MLERYPKAWSRWSHDEDEALRRLFDTGASVQTIADRLERHPGGIRARLDKLSLETETPDDSQPAPAPTPPERQPQSTTPAPAGTRTRTAWRERSERPGWDIRYTVIGGRLPNDALAGLDNSLLENSTRAISQAMVAASQTTHEPPDAIRFWTSGIRKILQRGTRPIIHHTGAGSLAPRQRSAEQLLAAISGPTMVDWNLDPNIELHPTYEQPFWDLIREQVPQIARWVTPQAWLEGLAGTSEAESERWVDFLLTVPWHPMPQVIELDGTGHRRRIGSDHDRDRSLIAAGIAVERFRGPDAIEPTHPPWTDLAARLLPPWLGAAEPSLVAAVHGPASLHRFAYALAEAVERGFLPAGRQWNIDLVDQVGVADRLADVALDLLGAFAEVWKTEVVPRRICINGVVHVRGSGGRFSATEERSSAKPSMAIRLEPFTPPHAALPESPVPMVVVRGCMLPIDMAWTPPTSVARHNRYGDDRALLALDRLLADLFGYEAFREGQRGAISRVLSGGDACVLLPTGAGKSLIYQLAGLLRPGVTVVVAPLRALIDDQDRRLHELGIDRVSAIHAGRGLNRLERSQVQQAIGRGDSCFVLVAPERLQIEEFRQQVRNAASGHLVDLAVVDEAHCVSEWGHQFRTSYLKLGRNLRNLCRDPEGEAPPILALTATASPRVLNDTLAELDLGAETRVTEDEPVGDSGILHRPATFDRPNLHYRAFPTSTENRQPTLSAAVEWIATGLGVRIDELGRPRDGGTLSGVVFVPHSRSGLDLGIDTYSGVLMTAAGIRDRSLIANYAGAPPRDGWDSADWETQKAADADAFRSNTKPVMVSTNAFGMGIDKPNIRYTVHVTLPSSIEAFAQESGRAGRDGAASYCAVLCPDETEGPLALIDRRRTADLNYARGDIEIQLNFLRGGFPDPETAITIATRIAEEILEGGTPGATVVIPRSRPRRRRPPGERNDEASTNEKALFRLLLIGMLEDYTIEYGADTFTVHLARFDADSLKATTRAFLERASGGNRTLWDRVEGIDPGPSAQVIADLLRILIESVHQTIEPARAQALREMLLLSRLGDDGEGIRQRINAYLSDGPVASLLDKVVRNEEDLLSTTRTLTEIPLDEYEWAGAAARYLESYPDHPLLLAVRALGEAWKRDGSRDEFARIARDFASAIGSFGIDLDEATALATWVLGLLREYFEGRRWAWAPDIWAALEDAPVADEILWDLEDAVLDLASQGRFDIAELDHVLARRIVRASRRGRTITTHHRMAG